MSASPSNTRRPRPPGMAMAGLRPVVAVYSTFLSPRPSTRPTSTSGCTAVRSFSCSTVPASPGTTGQSHHGILDMALALSIPGMTVFAPSSAEDVEPMLRAALALPGPSTIRLPKTAPRHVDPDEAGAGLRPANCARATGRSACSPWEDGGGVPGRGRGAGGRRSRRDGVGRPGGVTARHGDARGRGAAPTRGDGGGWRAFRRCRRIPGRLDGRRWPADAQRPWPSGSRASTWRRARPTTSWRTSAWTGRASPKRAEGGPRGGGGRAATLTSPTPSAGRHRLVGPAAPALEDVVQPYPLAGTEHRPPVDTFGESATATVPTMASKTDTRNCHQLTSPGRRGPASRRARSAAGRRGL